VSRNSWEVLDFDPFIKKLPQRHWRVLMSLMQCAKYCVEAIADADHQVISHVYHAKQVIPLRP
jgi:hypothetical protein